MTSVLDLADESFVSLATFRRSGDAVATPVWVGRDGDSLVVTTPSESGKIKRLRNDPRVTLRPCGRGGKVADDAPTREGIAEIIEDPERIAQLTDLVSDKYGLEYRVIMGAERIVKSGSRDRFILRITDV
jgi:PPOX class probable F420-dependent enzyme